MISFGKPYCSLVSFQRPVEFFTNEETSERFLRILQFYDCFNREEHTSFPYMVPDIYAYFFLHQVGLFFIDL